MAELREPGHVGVDPRSLLVDVKPRDNFVDVDDGAKAAPGGHPRAVERP
ncbi:hypothetical protein [Agrilutibacter solisilvae]|uniref:Uncharacterized protein n=1 Tax=Agrilutibacter solisilvae TaxID=2763317 RepID=A0A974Y6K0_9GAMM|nr:hypothetical protein [Lysobacter solisilvae]QSX79741.1 hypothetical protein I8J32_007870 [Lysobacter solisilvae]